MTLNQLCAIPILLVYALCSLLPVTLWHIVFTTVFNVSPWVWSHAWLGAIWLLVAAGFLMRADLKREIEVPPDGQA